jgi:hypothetical protein
VITTYCGTVPVAMSAPLAHQDRRRVAMATANAADSTENASAPPHVSMSHMPASCHAAERPIKATCTPGSGGHDPNADCARTPRVVAAADSGDSQCAGRPARSSE